MSTVALPNSKNVSARLDNGVLYLSCDLSKDFGPSSSGKTVVIASSCGNKPLGKSNAFIGLNLFVKSLDKRQLSLEAMGDLCQGSFLEFGSGCAWRIEPDTTTLCIQIDFSKVSEKPASSGKSVLLASSSGNKPVAATGVLCGLNCYRPEALSFDVTQLSAADDRNMVSCGEEKSLADGVKVRYPAHLHSPAFVTVVLPLTLFAEDGEEKKMRSFAFSVVDDVQVNLHVKAPSAKKRKTESKGAVTEGLALSDKARNLSSLVTTENAEKVLQLTFDKTMTFGASSSGKSVVISTSSGFQDVRNAAGEVLFTLNFNAYRSQSVTVTTSEVEAAVQEVLAATPAEEVPSLSFKAVRAEVLEKLNLSEETGIRYKNLIKEIITKIMSQKKSCDSPA